MLRYLIIVPLIGVVSACSVDSGPSYETALRCFKIRNQLENTQEIPKEQKEWVLEQFDAWRTYLETNFETEWQNEDGKTLGRLNAERLEWKRGKSRETVNRLLIAELQECANRYLSPAN